MKPKKRNVKNVNTDRWNGYFLDDTECQACLYYKGKKHGCSLTACSCEDIKLDAIANGRIRDLRTRVAAIDIGADGYMLIGKCDEDILETTNALIRRSSVYSNKTSLAVSLSIGELTIDLDNRKASISGQNIELTRKEFDILTFIISKKGEIVTYEQICDQAWGEDYVHDSYKPIMRLVYKLREKIKIIASPEYIINVREVGYRLISQSELEKTLC